MEALGNPKGKVVLEVWDEMLFLGLGFLLKWGKVEEVPLDA